MFNIILFISTYPVLLIIYFVLKNNHKFHDHLLFSVSMKEEWVEQPAVQKIISEFHKQMNILLLIFFAIPLTSLLTSHFSIQFTIWMNWLMLLILLFYVPYAVANKKLKKWKKENQFKTNEDEAWIFGLFYYNPKDKSNIVETRAGIGTSVNMATGLGKGLTIFSIIAMLSIPFISIFMIMEEFTPIHLVIKDDTLYCEHIFENYAIDTDTISNVSLVDELPSMVKSNGTAMDNLLKGKFHKRNQGNYELFLNPQHKYFIYFSADGESYYINGFDDKETLNIYNAIKD